MVEAGSGTRAKQVHDEHWRRTSGRAHTHKRLRRQHTITGRQSPCTEEQHHSSNGDHVLLQTRSNSDRDALAKRQTHTANATSSSPSLAWQDPGLPALPQGPARLEGGRKPTPTAPRSRFLCPLLWPRIVSVAVVVGSTQAPHSHAEQPGGSQAHSMWTARGMGWACSLTQPALGTTAQLDSAATCRWAGKSSERESVSRPGPQRAFGHNHTTGPLWDALWRLELRK